MQVEQLTGVTMPTLRLTDAALKRLKPPDAGRIEYWDSHTRGFGLRMSASGIKNWVLITRVLQGGEWKQKRVTLGAYPALSLSDAREKAAEAKAKAKAGEDPSDRVKTERQALVENSRNTFQIVRAEFLQKYRGRGNKRPAPSILAEMTRVLGSKDFEQWNDRPFSTITRRDILNALDVIIERGAETLANRALAYLKLLFAWAIEREIIEADPCATIKKPGAEVSRDRVLTANELRLVWKATEASDSQFGQIIRLLMLTGGRLREISELPWSEIDFQKSVWNLPGKRTKNGRDHLVPLTPPMLEILNARKSAQKALVSSDQPKPKLVSTTTGKTPFSGFSRGKSLLDVRINRLLAAAAEDDSEAARIPPWRPHDLRRSVATHMAEELRIAPHVIEACLNHVSGTKAGVAGVYNRALLFNERREALQRWSNYVLDLIGANAEEDLASAECSAG